MPPAGAFSRRRSACMVVMWCYVVEVGRLEQRIVFPPSRLHCFIGTLKISLYFDP